jgi:hypothetical protein
MRKSVLPSLAEVNEIRMGWVYMTRMTVVGTQAYTESDTQTSCTRSNERKKETNKQTKNKKRKKWGWMKMAPTGILIMLNFNRVLMLRSYDSGNSYNARINVQPDVTVSMTFSLCYNKLGQFERTSALAEEANSFLIHFGRKVRVTFRFNFRGICSRAQNKQRVSPSVVGLLPSAYKNM